MNPRKIAYFLNTFFIVLIFSTPILLATEEELQNALQKANQGDSNAAIEDLQKLELETPGDARIALSLGLLYQSTDQIDKAIAELEKAVGLRPTLEGYYALGLLYEAKGVQGDPARWNPKAQGAWEEYLKMCPLDHPRH